MIFAYESLPFLHAREGPCPTSFHPTGDHKTVNVYRRHHGITEVLMVRQQTGFEPGRIVSRVRRVLGIDQERKSEELIARSPELEFDKTTVNA